MAIRKLPNFYAAASIAFNFPIGIYVVLYKVYIFETYLRVFVYEEFKNHKIITYLYHLTLKIMVRTLLYDLINLCTSCIHETLDFGVGSNIFEVRDTKNFKINYVILTVDLETQGHAYLLYNLAQLWI